MGRFVGGDVWCVGVLLFAPDHAYDGVTVLNVSPYTVDAVPGVVERIEAEARCGRSVEPGQNTFHPSSGS